MKLSEFPSFHPARFCFLFLSAPVSVCAEVVLPQNHGQLEFTGKVQAVYDSNVFANAERQSDLLFTTHGRASFTRKAAYSLQAQVGWNSGNFSEFVDQDFHDPTLQLEVNTRWGARDASLRVESAGVSNADILLATRTQYRSESAAFDLSGPLFGHFGFSGSVSHVRDRFETTGLQDLRTSRLGFDLLRPITPLLDGFVGVGTTWDQAESQERSIDRALTAGVSRQILPKVSGSARVGVMERENSSQTADHRSFTNYIDLVWRPVRRLSVAVKASRDFSTIATGESISTWNSLLSVSLNLGTRWALSSSVGMTDYKFIDSEELTDRNVVASVNIERTLNSHLSVDLGGSWEQNSSTRSTVSDFGRYTLNFGVSGKW